MPTQLQRGDPHFGLTDQIEHHEPGRKRQFGGLHEQACGERGLVPTSTALITLEAPTINKAVLMPIAEGATAVVRPAGPSPERPHSAPQCRRASEKRAARGPSGTGCR